MRYYDVQAGDWHWTSHPGGGNIADPGAQEINMFLEVYNATDDPSHSMAVSDASTFEVKGVSWDQIKQSNTLINKPITIRGGMKPGLELATLQSIHAGVLATGIITRSWGNWVGTEMSIGMTFMAATENPSGNMENPSGPSSSGSNSSGSSSPSASVITVRDVDQARYRSRRNTGLRSIYARPFARGRFAVNPLDTSSSGGGGSSSNTPGIGLGGIFGNSTSSFNFGGIAGSFVGGGFPGLSQPLNLIHNLMPNMPLASAVQQTLSTAFPGMGMNINISSLLMLGYQDAGVYQNLTQYASYIFKLSKSINPDPNYFGVHTAVQNNQVKVWDIPTKGTNISVYELIGQPTWVDINIIEVRMAMRNDLEIGQSLTLPPGILTSIQSGGVLFGGTPSQQRTNITFESMTGQVIKINHIGDFRNPDGMYWSTVVRLLMPDITAPSAGDYSQWIPVAPIANNGDSPPKSNTNQPPQAEVIIGTPEVVQPQSFGSIVKRKARRW